MSVLTDKCSQFTFFAELWTEPSKRCTFRALKVYFYVVFTITHWREAREDIAAGRGVLLQGLVFLESEDTWPESCRSFRLFWIFPLGVSCTLLRWMNIVNSLTII